MWKSRTMAICAAACAAALVLATVASADIATPRARWTAVRMATEEVNVTLAGNKVTVDATFQMENTGKAAGVEMGYPLGVFEKDLNDFKVSVNEQPVGDVKTKAMPEPQGAAGSADAESYRFEGPYKSWKVFNVPFAENEKKTVRVTYWVEPAKIQEQGTAAPLLHYRYTLKTGATWKGNIGEAVLRVKLDGVQPDQILLVTPAGFVKDKDGKVLTWTLKDFKPTDNLEVTYRPAQ